jgi:hypothetical protein
VSRKKISTTVYITPEQDAYLKRLSGVTRVPVAEYIRMGIEMVMKKYEREVPPSMPFIIVDEGPL